jgi:MFS family permease
VRLEGDARAEWRQHWAVVLAACMGVAASSMMTYAVGLFIEPLQREFGWSRAQITSGPALASLACVVMTPFVGAALDRFGPRRIALPGLIAALVCVCLLPVVALNYGRWMGMWLLLALLTPLVLPNVWATVVSGLFRAGRGLALGLTLVGSGISTIVTPLVAFWLIEEFGWRLAFVGLAAFWGALSIPLVFAALRGPLERKTSQQNVGVFEGERRVGSWRESGVFSSRFLRLALAGLLFAAVVPPLVISIFPVLAASGLDRSVAANVASLVGVAAIFGRILVGFLLDRFEARHLGLIITMLPLASSLLLLTLGASLPLAVLAALSLGIALGAEYDIVAYMASRYFPISHFGLLFGTLAGLIAFAGAGGPVWMNAIFDATGSYRLALQLMLPLCPLAGLLFLSLGSYPDEQRAAPQG